MEEPGRRDALARFLIISGLRRLAPAVQEETQKVPILNDILDHEVLGPAIRQGLEQGLQQGRQEGEHEGRYVMLKKLILKRFGTIPARIETRLAKLSADELDAVALRLVEVSDLDQIFPEAKTKR